MVSITVALSLDDPDFAQEVCLQLSTSSDEAVRGNAIVSLGHLARRFRSLDESMVKPALESALGDPAEHVRALARSAADEAHQFLGWTIRGHEFGASLGLREQP